MQYNSETNNQDIISDISFWTGADLNSYSLKDRTRDVNETFREIWAIIFESYGGWKFMDDNISDASTGVPYTDQTITSGSGLFPLPTGALAVDGVQMKTTASGPLNPLKPITLEQFLDMGGDGAFPATGVPLYYLLQGDIGRLLPTPNFTLATALRVMFDQDISSFLTTDTTKVPGFAVTFHRMLSIGPSLNYCDMNKGLEAKAVKLQNRWNKYEVRLRDFYSKRFKALFPHRIPPAADLVEEFS